VIEILPPLPAAWPFQPPTLRVQISTRDLDSDVPYEALSYCWGVSAGQLPDRRVIITEDGRPESAELFIHQNLAQALTSIQRNMPAGLRIFADGICINQQDEKEMDAQVKLMGDIYKRCSRVIVWLGPGTRDSDRFFDAANEIGSDPSLLATLDMPPQIRAPIYIAAADRYAKVPSVSPHESVLDDASLQLAHQLGRMVSSHVESFPAVGYADVLQRAWFNRLWVIQEAALPPDGLFLCGSKWLSFQQFRGIFLFYGMYSKIWLHTRKKALPSSEYRLRDDIFQKSTSFVRIFRERALFPGSEPATLIELVKRFNVNDMDTKIGAAKSKDRIFALGGLSRDSTMLKGWPYEAGAAETYTKLAEESIRTDVDILLFAQRRHPQRPANNLDNASELASLPSWVPNWSLDPIELPCGYTRVTDDKSVYAAGGTQRGQVPTVDGSALGLRGVLLDRIVILGKQQLQREKDSITPRQLDQISVKLFFDEIDTLLDEASARREGQVQEAKDEDEERLRAAICLADASLTIRQLPAESAKDAIKEVYDQVRKLSSFIALSREARDTYMSLGRTYAKHRPQIPRRHWVFPPLVLVQLLVAGFSAILAVGYMRLYIAFTRLRDWRQLLSPYNALDVPMVTGAGGGKMAIRSHPAAADYKHNMFRNIGKRLYVTQSGYVGLGPQTIQEGDCVVVFFGGSSPFILRPNSAGRVADEPRGGDDDDDADVGAAPPDGSAVACTLVGETYCHGFMDGEALSQEQAGKKTTTFWIS